MLSLLGHLTLAQSAFTGTSKLLIVLSCLILIVGLVLWAWGAKYIKVLLGIIGAGVGLVFGSILGIGLLSNVTGGISAWLIGATVFAAGFAFLGVAYPRFSTALFASMSLGAFSLGMWSAFILPSAMERTFETVLAHAARTSAPGGKVIIASAPREATEPTFRVAGAEGFPPDVLQALEAATAPKQSKGVAVNPVGQGAGVSTLRSDAKPNAAPVRVLAKDAPTTTTKQRVTKPTQPPAKQPTSQQTTPVYQKGLATRKGTNGSGGTHVSIRSAKQEVDLGRLHDIQHVPEHVLAAEKLVAAQQELKAIEAEHARLAAQREAHQRQASPATPVAGLAAIAALSPESAKALGPVFFKALPWRELMLGLLVTALLSIGAFVAAFMKPKIAACVVTGIVGAAWISSAVSTGAAGVPALREFFDMPMLSWVILWVGLGAAGVYIQLNQVRRAAELASSQAQLVARPLPMMGMKTGDIMPPPPMQGR